ncbi:tyrosine-type recombinase/integrase [Isoptericola dokdonensis]|nr:tyrosine-type recombinase/integrase [Isoptericola dokdonensis]
MTLLLTGTDLRWGEAAGLHRARVDPDRRVLDVLETWSVRGVHMKPYPKGRRRRQVPIPAWIDLAQLQQPAASADCGYEHIEGRCPGALLLATSSGTIVEHAKFSKAFAAAVRAADVGRVRVHDLRHTYASWLIQGGRPLAEVGKLLGHVSPITTQRYAHLAEVDADDILAALGPGPEMAPVPGGSTSSPPVVHGGLLSAERFYALDGVDVG